MSTEIVTQDTAKIKLVYEKHDKPMTDSLKVAECFEKRHDNVIKDIRELDCSEEFRLLNFEESSYKNEQNKKQPMYRMTFDGFTFLAMGYRGKKAAQFKESYIKAFNNMAAVIRQLETAKLENKDFTEAIKQAHGAEYHNYHFSNEHDLINRIVLGMSSKQFRKQNNIPENADSIRPYLSAQQLEGTVKLQRFDMGLVMTVKSYDERKKMLTDYFNRVCGRQIGAAV